MDALPRRGHAQTEESAEALAARAKVIRSRQLGTLSTDTKITVRWLPWWLAARIERGELRDGPAADYRDSITRYLVPRAPVPPEAGRPPAGAHHLRVRQIADS